MASALTFDGVNDWVTVNDANDLDFTTAMTMEAWVYPTASGGGSWRTVLIKERPSGEVYNLYANADTQCAGGVCGALGAARPAAARRARHGGAATEHVDAPRGDVRQHDAAAVRERGAGGQPRGRRSPADLDRRRCGLAATACGANIFAGRIDEVRLYNRALAADEIQADMAAPIGTDATPPARSNGQPSGTLPAGTTQTTLSLTTNENATCQYGTARRRRLRVDAQHVRHDGRHQSQHQL